jgi:hypothetical protein
VKAHADLLTDALHSDVMVTLAMANVVRIDVKLTRAAEPLRGRSRLVVLIVRLVIAGQHQPAATAVAGRVLRGHRLGGGAVPARAAIHAHHLVRMRVDLGPAPHPLAERAPS